MNTIINCASYCIPTVNTVNSNVANKNETLGFKNIADIIITPGIGNMYGEEPVGNTTAVIQVNIVNMPASDINLGSKSFFSKTFKYAIKISVTSNTRI